MRSYKIKKTVTVQQDIDVEGTLNEVIGYNVHRLRKNKGMNQEELAEKVTFSRASISNIEIGRHGLTIKNLEELCQVFDCKSSDILPF